MSVSPSHPPLSPPALPHALYPIFDPVGLQPSEKTKCQGQSREAEKGPGQARLTSHARGDVQQKLSAFQQTGAPRKPGQFGLKVPVT